MVSIDAWWKIRQVFVICWICWNFSSDVTPSRRRSYLLRRRRPFPLWSDVPCLMHQRPDCQSGLCAIRFKCVFGVHPSTVANVTENILLCSERHTGVVKILMEFLCVLDLRCLYRSLAIKSDLQWMEKTPPMPTRAMNFLIPARCLAAFDDLC